MEYADLLAGRRSTRRFDTSRDVPDDVIERVLAAPLAVPHAGNTYDWRGVVLRRRDRDPETWPAVYAALLGQSYVEEAAVLIAYAVQPGWWAERYRGNVAGLGATVTACKPAELAEALRLPGGAVLCPWGVLAIGWPLPGQGPPPAGAPKPELDGMYFAERWGRPWAAPTPVE